MKRYTVGIIAIALLGAMSLSLAGCGGDKGTDPKAGQEQSQSQEQKKDQQNEDKDTGDGEDSIMKGILKSVGKDKEADELTSDKEVIKDAGTSRASKISDRQEIEDISDRISAALVDARYANGMFKIEYANGSGSGAMVLNSVHEAFVIDDRDGKQYCTLMNYDGREFWLSGDEDISIGVDLNHIALIEKALDKLGYGDEGVKLLEVYADEKVSSDHDYYKIKIEEDALRDIYGECKDVPGVKAIEVVDSVKKEYCDSMNDRLSTIYTIALLKNGLTEKGSEIGIAVRIGSEGNEKKVVALGGYQEMNDWSLSLETYTDSLWEGSTTTLAETYANDIVNISKDLGLQ